MAKFGIGKDKILEILLYYSQHGETKTIRNFNIKSDTIRRYRDFAQKEFNINIEKNIDLEHIRDTYSDKEIKAIAKGGRIIPGMAKVPIVDFEGERIRIGALTDTHFGSLFTDPNYIHKAFEEFKKEKIDFIVHAGDVTEGMSNRAGHIYELSHIGYDAQKEHAIDVLKEWTDTKIYMIDGNHDRWYLKSNGAKIVKAIANSLPNAEYLGHDEGDISLKGNVTLKLWHGKDSSSYALSYRLQKIIESLSGGEKPNILLCGHTHKYVNIFLRNIYTYSLGCIQKQTSWMRGKRISAHPGFNILDFWINKSGVTKARGTFYPFFS